MMSDSWKWPGARWWRCDFHVHTPASHDARFGKDCTAEDWVAAVVAAEGLDAVAVTDHNTPEWVDQVATAAREYDSLTVFPGVEITVEPGVHLLALFDPEAGGDRVKTLLARLNIDPDDWGKPEALARVSISDALARVEEAKGLVIAAHIDDPKGLLRELGRGESLQKILADPNLSAVELGSGGSASDAEREALLALLGGSKKGYRRSGCPLPRLTFSDAHALDAIGRRSTWIKMTRPTLEGLRLALQDGELSVRPAAEAGPDPNGHGAMMIERLEVENARYHGRFKDHEGKLEPFALELNPWLNAIIGGRGTGKSSLVEFLRIALRREGELPEALSSDFESFRQIAASRNAPGVLTEATRLSVVFLKDGARFRLQWSPRGDLDPIEEWHEGEWHKSEGDVAQRFPVRIMSQKQIFELASDPGALLGIVDAASEIDRRGWDDHRRDLENRFSTLGAKIREIDDDLKQESQLRGVLDDVKRQLNVIEQSGQARILREVGLRRRQKHALDTWLEELLESPGNIREALVELQPAAVDSEQFGGGDEDREALALVARTGERVDGVRRRFEELAGQLAEIAVDAQDQLESSAWKSALDAAERQYQEMSESEEIRSQYSRLMQERRRLEERLGSFEARRGEREGLGEEAAALLEQILQHRLELTRRRKDFLAKALRENPYVRIKVVPFGAKDSVESELRDILRLGNRFARDLGSVEEGKGRLGKLYRAFSRRSFESRWDAEFVGRLKELKRGLADLIKGVEQAGAKVRDSRFAKALGGLGTRDLSQLWVWFPEDWLHIEYSADGRRFQSIEQGSPGQKTAALLAFLLSYGDEPMILDQPEDDLDNHLIYDLIVTQLRQIKKERQVIVVTHNPNIVVNGDAELVTVLGVVRGQSRRECRGGLQEQEIRDAVCRVMEGGREAFDNRYRRIVGGKERGDGR